MSNAAPDAQLNQFHSYAETERSALAAEAIKRLVAENKLCVAALRFWIASSCASLDHFTLIRESYRKLANEADHTVAACRQTR